jgi:hypothetical protein
MLTKYKKFQAWGPWNIATLAFAICLAIVPFVVAATADSLQGIVAGIMTGSAAAFASLRYFQWRQEYGRQWTFYSPTWGCNVFCTDVRARERWNFGVSKAFTDAISEVAGRFEDTAHVYFEGLTFDIVDKPFPLPGGLAMGAYYPSRHLIRMAWPEANNWPPTLHHELLHVILAQRDNLDGNEATHQRMHEMAEAGIVPRAWC